MLDCSALLMYNFNALECRGGGIGRHARFRFLWALKSSCGFKSRPRHHVAFCLRKNSWYGIALKIPCFLLDTAKIQVYNYQLNSLNGEGGIGGKRVKDNLTKGVSFLLYKFENRSKNILKGGAFLRPYMVGRRTHG